MINTIPLMDVIMGGESRTGNGYDIVNTSAYGRPYRGTPITQLSLDEVMALQGKQFGAAGAFQGIKDTLKRYKKGRKLSGRELFNAAQQQDFFHWLLDQSDDMRNYRSAKSDIEAEKHLKNAGRYLASQWAALENPYTPGRGMYDGKSGNKMNTSWAKVEPALRDYRRGYRLATTTHTIRLANGQLVGGITDEMLNNPAERRKLKAKLRKHFGDAAFNAPTMPQVRNLKSPIVENTTTPAPAPAPATPPAPTTPLKEKYNPALADKQALESYKEMDNLGAWAGKLQELEGEMIGKIGDFAKWATGGNETAEKMGRGVGHILNNAAYFIPGVGQAKFVADVAPALAGLAGNLYYRGGEDTPKWLRDYNKGAELGHKKGTTGSMLGDMLTDIVGGGVGAVRGLSKAGQAMQAIGGTSTLGKKLEKAAEYVSNAPMNKRIKEIQKGAQHAEQQKAALAAEYQALRNSGAPQADIINKGKQLQEATEIADRVNRAAEQGVKNLLTNNLKEQKKTALNYVLSSGGATAGTVLGEQMDNGEYGAGALGGILGGALAPFAAKRMLGNTKYWQDNFAPHYENSGAITNIGNNMTADLAGRLQRYADDPSFTSYRAGAGADEPVRNYTDYLNMTWQNNAPDGLGYMENSLAQQKIKADIDNLVNNADIFPEQYSRQKNYKYYLNKDEMKSLGDRLQKELDAMHYADKAAYSKKYGEFIKDMELQISPAYERQVNNSILAAGGDPNTMTTAQKLPYQLNAFMMDVIQNRPEIISSRNARHLLDAYQALWEGRYGGQSTMTRGVPIQRIRDYEDSRQLFFKDLNDDKEGISYIDVNGKTQTARITDGFSKSLIKKLITEFENNIYKGGNVVQEEGFDPSRLATETRQWYKNKVEEQKWTEGGLQQGVADYSPIKNFYQRIQSGKITPEEMRGFIKKLRDKDPAFATDITRALWAQHLNSALGQIQLGKQLDLNQLRKFSKTLGFNTADGSNEGFTNTMNLLDLIKEATNNPSAGDSISKSLNSIAANTSFTNDLARDSKNIINDANDAFLRSAATQSPSTSNLLSNMAKWFRADDVEATGKAGQKILSDPNKVAEHWAEVVGAVGNRRRLADRILAYMLGTTTGIESGLRTLDKEEEE